MVGGNGAGKFTFITIVYLSVGVVVDFHALKFR